MATSAPDYTVVRFSSCALPEQERGKALEELCERGLLATRFMPCGDAAPHVDFANRIIPGLRILTATYAGVRHENGPARKRASKAAMYYLSVWFSAGRALREGARGKSL